MLDEMKEVVEFLQKVKMVIMDDDFNQAMNSYLELQRKITEEPEFKTVCVQTISIIESILVQYCAMAHNIESSIKTMTPTVLSLMEKPAVKAQAKKFNDICEEMKSKLFPEEEKKPVTIKFSYNDDKITGTIEGYDHEFYHSFSVTENNDSGLTEAIISYQVLCGDFTHSLKKLVDPKIGEVATYYFTTGTEVKTIDVK